MWKTLIIGKEPENTSIFCDCGSKYRSDSDWIYFERKDNLELQLLSPEHRSLIQGMGAIQKNKYKCPYCNVKDKLSDPSINYTKAQLIKFCEMTHVEYDKTDNKKILLQKLTEAIVRF